MSATANNCLSAIRVYDNNSLRLAGLSQFIISIFALIMFIYVYVFNFKRPLTPIHANLKVLYVTTALLSVIHALGIIITELVNEYTRHINRDNPCDLQWSTLPCILLRSPILITIPSFTLLHAGITAERFFATLFSRTYEHMGTKLSMMILYTIATFVLFCSYFVLRNADLAGKHDYCLLSFVASGDAMQGIYKMMSFLNLPTTLMDIVLLIHNRKQLNLTTNKALSNYKLSEVYQLRENVIITKRVTLPLMICRIFTDSVYLLAQGTSVRAYFSITPMSTYTYIQCTYCLICLYTFLAIFIPYYCRLPKRLLFAIRPNRTHEETNAHFENLNVRFQEAYSQRQQKYMSRKFKA